MNMKKMNMKFVFIFGLIIFIFSVIYNNDDFKTFWITTAMTTKSHKFLAYIYSEDTISKVMNANYVEVVDEEIDLDDIVISNTFEKDSFSSEYEKEIYTKDNDDDLYKIIRIEEDNFKGYLTVIYDPSAVSLGVSSKLGEKGESVNTICKNNNGIICINGGGFEDFEGWKNGAVPAGVVIQDGEVIWNSSKGVGTLIGFTKEHKLILTSKIVSEALEIGVVDAIEFGPILILNGKKSKIHGDGGWGVAPRTAIGQRKDGIVLFLVIEGRLPGYSLGATMQEVMEVLYKYGAYNAVNLDGGSSSTMSVNGELFNRPSAGEKYGGRVVSNAWVVTDNKKGE